MRRQELLDDGDTHVEAVLGEAIGALLVREVRPLDLGLHRRTRGVILQDVATGRFQTREHGQARLASAACAPHACLLKGVGSGQFLHALSDRRSVTPEDTGDRPEASTAELLCFNRSVTAAVLCR